MRTKSVLSGAADGRGMEPVRDVQGACPHERGDAIDGPERPAAGHTHGVSRRAVLGLMAAAALAGSRGGGAAPAMLERRIPADGALLPVVGLGTWQTFDVGRSAADRAPLREVLRRFAALGGRVVDSSPMYGEAEAVVGDLATELGLHPTLFVATKVWTHGREAGIAQMARSHRQLRVDHLDLLKLP